MLGDGTWALQQGVPAVPSALTYFASAHPDLHTDFLGGFVIQDALGDGTEIFTDYVIA